MITQNSIIYIFFKSKDEIIEKFINEVENHLNKRIKVVWSDWRGEYVSPFAEFCVEHEIKHETIPPYTP